MNPYLSFAGTCEEAMNYYKGILGGELSVMHFGGSPMESDVPADFKGKVMHSSLVAPSGTLMASDSWQTLSDGNRVSISVTLAKDEGKRIFDALAQGGTVTMPYGEVFWGGSFGMAADKYGFLWLISGN